jgi:sugar O-acyltransferase (sialic acid O-acetyltransferase NeuD family)
MDLIIVGCGGHGREVFGTVAAVNSMERTWNVVGFVDDHPRHIDRVDRLGSQLLGDLGWLMERRCAYVLGIGTSDTRRDLATRLDDSGARPVTVVHPRSTVGADSRLGDGVVVFEHCAVTTNVTIGRHTHLNVGCAVQHDTIVGEFVQFSPGVYVNGDCVIGDDVFLGTGAIVTRGCTVGAGARVGAGAVVLDDVEPGMTVVGSPARPMATTR